MVLQNVVVEQKAQAVRRRRTESSSCQTKVVLQNVVVEQKAQAVRRRRAAAAAQNVKESQSIK